MPTEPFTIRWGIIATGGISSTFAKDLLFPSELRDASDVKHVITAVGSRSIESAEKFIKECKLPEPAKGYKSYQEVFDSKDVDVIYIGTPHTHHYPNAHAALTAGKHVLCEKPFTWNLKELDSLIALAKSKKLFLMEAVWTRFHPIAYKLQEEVFGGKYGGVKRIFADLSMDFDLENKPDGHRMIDPALGGGSLMDLAPYPSVWTMLLMHNHTVCNPNKLPPDFDGISAHMKLYKRSGVDEITSWTVGWNGEDWPNGGAVAHLTAAMTVKMSKRYSVLVQMEKADIEIAFPTYRPESYTIIHHSDTENFDELVTETIKVPIPHGMKGINYQADEVARCIRDGKQQSERMSWEDSRIVMRMFDIVREKGGYAGGYEGKLLD